jgi:hypothetical protein
MTHGRSGDRPHHKDPTMPTDRKSMRSRRPIHRSRLIAELLETRQLLAVIMVNSSGDADGADGSDTLSLRQAIEVSNGTLAISSLTPTQASLVVGALSSPNTIDFAIPGTGPFTIMPGTALPTITSPVVIDGYSEPGAHPNTNGPGQGKNTVIQIEIDGANAPAGANGLDVQAGDSIVQGLAIGGFTVSNASGSPVGGDGILLEMQTGDLIQGDFIGTNTTGESPLPNAVGLEDTNRYEGVGHTPIPGFNTVGGTAAGDGNVISGNLGGQVDLQGEAGFFFQQDPVTDLIQGNFLGLDAAGVASLAGGGDGIYDTGGGSSTIGGTALGAGNVISGNAGDGLGIFGYIQILNGEGDKTVFASTDLVEGNRIGTNAAGLVAVPNSGDGISASGGPSTIGGTTLGAGNVISGNIGDGLGVSDGLSEGVYGYSSVLVLVEGNDIGVDLTGTASLPNEGDGVHFTNSVGSSTIGGTSLGAGNIIDFNHAAGVDIATTVSGNNSYYCPPNVSVFGNSIYANGALGIIDSSGEGSSPPTLDFVTASGTGSLITGTIAGIASQPYRIEFFSNVTPDLSGFGQGQTYLGSTLATPGAGGTASFTFTSTSPLLGQYVSATSTPFPPLPIVGGDLNGFPGDAQTSPFSKNLIGYTLPTTTVSLAGPSGVVLQGQPITLSATVASSSGGVPTGEVTFSADGVVLGSAPLGASGVAVFTADGLGPGAHAFQAAYLGDATNAPSSSNAVAVTVVAPTTTVSLLGPNRVATQGVPITFAVAVASNTGAVPTGLVAFLEDGVVLGSSPLDASGLASFVTDQLLPGPHVITAEYLGGPTIPAGLSNAVAVQVFSALAFGGPAVTSDVFSGPNAVTVTFNRGLFIGPAQDITNYKIMGPRRQAITILSAVYDPSNASVTLTTAQPLDPHKTYQLTINGQKGDRVVDVFGIALNGKTKGKPGHNYSGKIKVKKVPVEKVTHASAPKPKVHATAHKKGR